MTEKSKDLPHYCALQFTLSGLSWYLGFFPPLKKKKGKVKICLLGVKRDQWNFLRLYLWSALAHSCPAILTDIPTDPFLLNFWVSPGLRGSSCFLPSSLDRPWSFHVYESSLPVIHNSVFTQRLTMQPAVAWHLSCSPGGF